MAGRCLFALPCSPLTLPLLCTLQTMAMMGITFNVHALCFFAAHGLSGAASTRVGNDLGAGRPQMAWLTVQVGCFGRAPVTAWLPLPLPLHTLDRVMCTAA